VRSLDSIQRDDDSRRKVTPHLDNPWPLRNAGPEK
jgi:hypothetical protein